MSQNPKCLFCLEELVEIKQYENSHFHPSLKDPHYGQHAPYGWWQCPSYISYLKKHVRVNSDYDAPWIELSNGFWYPGCIPYDKIKDLL